MEQKLEFDYEDSNKSRIFFKKSLRYLEGIVNLLIGGRYGRDDFEQINAYFLFAGLEANLDLGSLHQRIERLSIRVEPELIDEVQLEVDQLMEDYALHSGSFYVVDDEFIYSSISGAVRHALAVYCIAREKKIDESVLVKFPKLRDVLSKSHVTDSIIGGFYFNSNFYSFDHGIFPFVDCKFVVRSKRLSL
jgi:hypothetical protein